VPFTAIINKSLETGEVPSSLKLAKVVPIYKAKNKEEFNNYRPVSLLPCISKILEKVIHKRLYNFLLLNDVLYKSQYGFRPKHSTSNAITELSNDIITSLENKQLTLAVFLDLSKAFDTIDHMTLLDKLAHYGVRGVALEWFRSYLTNRRQYVQVNDNRSQIDTITYGVPQGSVLGPLLFIIYTNDLPRNLKTVKSILFADDTTIYQSSNNTEKLYKAMNEQLKILEDWFKANKLSLNASKTNYILFRNKNMELNDKNNKLLINGEEIVWSQKLNSWVL
jgi:retron-type reverse transcriptase